MGLSMYLTKIVEIPGKDFSRLKIEEDAGQWRKANAIHRWFVEHVQGGEDDCGSYAVNREALQELLEIIKQVLADYSKAEELLPTQAGFHFGETAYDDWYFADLKRTKKILENAIRDLEGYYEYTSSW